MFHEIHNSALGSCWKHSARLTTSILHSRTVKLCALSTILASVGSYFSAVDLAEFAHVLDEAEKARMAEGDITPSGLNRLMQVDTCLIPRLDSEPDWSIAKSWFHCIASCPTIRIKPCMISYSTMQMVIMPQKATRTVFWSVIYYQIMMIMNFRWCTLNVNIVVWYQHSLHRIYLGMYIYDSWYQFSVFLGAHIV